MSRNRCKQWFRPRLQSLEDRTVPSGIPAYSGALELALKGRITPADFINPPSPIGTTSSTDANVNTDVEPLFHNETTIAVNPTNPLNMIGSANDFQAVVNGNGQIFTHTYSRARVTFDGGRTWTTYPVPYHGYGITNDPAISFDADGTAYLATLGTPNSQSLFHPPGSITTGPDIIVSRSTDGGRTWSDPVRVATGKGAEGEKVLETFNDKEYIAAWGHGNAIVTWTQFNWGPQGEFLNAPILASVTHDGGRTWTAPAQISGPFVIDQGSVPTVAADGSIYVTFISYDGVAPEYRDHYMVVQVDPATGQALGDPVEVGTIYNGFNDYPFNVQGRQTYQDSQFRTFPWGNITADPTDPRHLAVIWSDMRNNPYPGAVLPSHDPYQVRTNSDIVVSQSFDGGRTWSAPAAIAAANDQFMPWGAYDASGRLQIGYFDRSYDPANHKYGYTLASETAPDTLNFVTQQVTTALSDPTRGAAFPLVVTVNPDFPQATTFIGDYTGIAVTPTGVAALWTDMRVPAPGFPGSGENVFFAFVDTPEPMTAAAAVAGKPRHRSLTPAAVGPILSAALARWEAAGVDTSALAGIEFRITNLSGATLGLASGNTIWLDDNAAGWGWFVDRTPHSDAEFTRRGNQGEKNRMDLLTVLEHEVGHLLGYDHEAGGVMRETLDAGVRRTMGSTTTSATDRPGGAPTLFAWSADTPWINELVSGNGKRR